MIDTYKFIYREHFKYGFDCRTINGHRIYSLKNSPYLPYDLTAFQDGWANNIQLFIKYGVFK